MQPYGAYGGDNSYQHATKSNPSRKRFTTYDRDVASGMDYAVNRYYSSWQGRFTQVDPSEMGSVELGNPQSLNLYAYVEGDPVNSSDPLGLDGFSLGGFYPTGGGGGGSNGLSLGPFSFSFGFGSGFGSPMIPWFPLPIYRNGFVLGQMQMTQEPQLPKVQQQPPADPVVFDSVDIVDTDPGWLKSNLLIGQELMRGAMILSESERAVHARNWYFMRYGREDGLIPDPRQFPLSALIFGERLVDPNTLTDKDFTDRAEFEYFSGLAGGGGTIKAITSAKRIYSARVLTRMAEEPGPYHNFPESFNKMIFQGSRTVISNNYILYKRKGTLNGVDGVFEIGVRPSQSGKIEIITHRFFRPDKR
jgi:RHS repeat-associated protein